MGTGMWCADEEYRGDAYRKTCAHEGGRWVGCEGVTGGGRNAWGLRRGMRVCPPWGGGYWTMGAG